MNEMCHKYNNNNNVSKYFWDKNTNKRHIQNSSIG